jgi:DNA-binding NarL/FixJ family response regulator
VFEKAKETQCSSGASAVKAITPDTVMSRLSQQKREISRLIALGHSNAEIGTVLNLDRTVVAEEVEQLFTFLDLTNRVQIAALVLRYDQTRGGGAKSVPSENGVPGSSQ